MFEFNTRRKQLLRKKAPNHRVRPTSHLSFIALHKYRPLAMSRNTQNPFSIACSREIIMVRNLYPLQTKKIEFWLRNPTFPARKVRALMEKSPRGVSIPWESSETREGGEERIDLQATNPARAAERNTRMKRKGHIVYCVPPRRPTGKVNTKERWLYFTDGQGNTTKK
ncbi:hypothetical protein B296_00001978 [Ensete ventricosum]|uniref:Uncharacterized protein n=1 Tax=Ensete ventricosum TaxID=4639 RepID=A0A427A994_ENSVE|nr:hypothetical protein B296_00001978 [Ensete ventricosum]